MGAPKSPEHGANGSSTFSGCNKASAVPARFDVAPDDRFVAVRVPGGLAGQPDLRMLLNWPEDVKRLEGVVPTRSSSNLEEMRDTYRNQNATRR